EPRALEQARQPFAKKHVVVRERHARVGCGHADDYRRQQVCARWCPGRDSCDLRDAMDLGHPMEVVALRCLLVDDSRRFLEAASKLLVRQGLAVAGVASSSAEALARVRELEPDVTIVDAELNGESGFAL